MGDCEEGGERLAGEGEGNGGADIIARAVEGGSVLYLWTRSDTGEPEQPNSVNNTSSNEGRS